MMDGGEQRVGKLQWRCRRGMKELDVLLSRFLERHHADLLAGAWPQFEAFLDEDGNSVSDWLQGRAVPDREDYQQLLAAIRTVS